MGSCIKQVPFKKMKGNEKKQKLISPEVILSERIEKFSSVANKFLEICNKKAAITRALCCLSEEYTEARRFIDNNDPTDQATEITKKLINSDMEAIFKEEFSIHKLTARLDSLSNSANDLSKHVLKEKKIFSEFSEQAERNGIGDYQRGYLHTIKDLYSDLERICRQCIVSTGRETK